jgi:hypothetical protein
MVCRYRCNSGGRIMLLNPKDETEHLDYACYEMFGHSDWEYVEDKDTHITIKFNVEDTREEEE